ncbi:MAG: MBL fold metallo-hydrolase, partial [Deltaproteobacteria bacterium]
TLALGSEARVTLLLPHEPFLDAGRSDVNANSVVARVESGRVHVLFTGDAERPTEQRLLAEQTAGTLAADVLKVAHHGSRFASSAALVDAVHPRFAVISCGAGNGYGHPHAATLNLLAARGVVLHRTDLEGDVSLTTDGASVSLEGTRVADPVSLGTPGTRRRGANEPN